MTRRVATHVRSLAPLITTTVLLATISFVATDLFAVSATCPTAACNGKKPTTLGPCPVEHNEGCSDKNGRCPAFDPDNACILNLDQLGDQMWSMWLECTGADWCSNNHCQASTFSVPCRSKWACKQDPATGKCVNEKLCGLTWYSGWKMHACCGYTPCDPYHGY